MFMEWELLNVVGTIAFAASGAIIAMDEKYDIFGVWLLAFTTAFGGGAIRNVLLGNPVSLIWQQNDLFILCFLVALLIFLLPSVVLPHWERWGVIVDAIGLVAFSFQGAQVAIKLGLPLSAAIAAAVLTGVGGGVIRDLLAGRKPLVLQAEVYAIWAIIIAVVTYYFRLEGGLPVYALLIVVATLRVISYYRKWNLPARKVR
ncbi:UPF0126 domain protein [Exiguobacterium sp. S17]|nr:UPF0126 domain protein [Exiguobacterium sp. S17]